MHFTRPRELLIAGLLGLVGGFLLFEFAYDSIPRLPRPAGATLGVLAIIEVVLAFGVRSRIRAGRVHSAIAIARAVALAKASSLLGALMTGFWVGSIGFLAPNADRLTAASRDLTSALIGAVCAVVLIGAALWLEHCCRAPEPRDSDRPTGATD
ncbi:hypothetical protein CFN78_22285 [Amycolatopsis antarctica]|uniref:DUF3180 domain-containing protein n=1 Tax=Amycolatopsis antarctica TaxID=1854586 RepID=A0A263CZS2_9PSEU|nr:DUF3180 domain-containing protein [Amycolatopsis antarctica]OZM70897.1 hypothetical protein CFN78_22285 [Amycolatopsis antarctica]